MFQEILRLTAAAVTSASVRSQREKSVMVMRQVEPPDPNAWGNRPIRPSTTVRAAQGHGSPSIPRVCLAGRRKKREYHHPGNPGSHRLTLSHIGISWRLQEQDKQSQDEGSESAAVRQGSRVKMGPKT
jgi:hypothetical protein